MHFCSQRLKMLTDEMEKLRDEFVKANKERHAPPPLPAQPAPPPAPPQQREQMYYDGQFFDPTEDPLAFMRGPRRRANSFSGHGGNYFLSFRILMYSQLSLSRS